MNAYVYILLSESGRYYIGSTTDIERRLKQHNAGQTSTTKRFGSFKLVFSQKVNSLEVARRAEKKIKSWKRKDFVEKIVKEGKIRFLNDGV